MNENHNLDDIRNEREKLEKEVALDKQQLDKLGSKIDEMGKNLGIDTKELIDGTKVEGAPEENKKAEPEKAGVESGQIVNNEKSSESRAFINARNEYFDALNKYNKERSTWNKIRASLGVKESYKNSKFEKVTKAKELYDSERVAYGNKMYAAKKEELERTIPSDSEELNLKLEEYKKTVIFERVHEKEYKKMLENRAEKLPPERKTLLKETLNTTWGWAKAYSELGKKGKVLFSIPIPKSDGKKFDVTTGFIAKSVTTSAFFTLLSGAGAVSLGARVARGLSSGVTAGITNKLFKNQQEKNLQKLEIDLEKEKDALKDKFARGAITVPEYEKEKAKLDKKLEKKKKIQMATRVAASILVGMGTSTAMSAGFNGAEDTTDNTKNQDINTENKTGIKDIAPKKIPSEKTELPKAKEVTPEPIESTPEATQDEPVVEENKSQNEAVDKKGDGADKAIESKKVAEFNVSEKGSIQSMINLKAELRNLYPDASQAPENVQHILKTNPTELAKEFGLFDPTQVKESAMMLKGSKYSIDENGNVWLFNKGSGETNLLSGSNKYSGDMFDSGKGVVNKEALSNDNIWDQKAEGIGEEQGTPAPGDDNIWNNEPETIKSNEELGGEKDLDTMNKKGSLRVDGSESIPPAGDRMNWNQYWEKTHNTETQPLNTQNPIDQTLTYEEFIEKKDALVDRMFEKKSFFARAGHNSEAWKNLSNKNMNELTSSDYKFASNREEVGLKNVISTAKAYDIDYKGKTLNQVVEDITKNA